MAKPTVRSAAIASWILALLAVGALAMTHCADDPEHHLGNIAPSTTVLDGALDEPEPMLIEAKLPIQERRQPALPTGEVFVPTQVFDPKGDALDRRINQANPRVYLYEDYDPGAREHILIVGMPGWGGRSENFIWTLINGLKHERLTPRLVVASIQDLENGGPRYQGQGARTNANVWSVGPRTVEATRRFVSALAEKLGHPLTVYFMGFSTGGISAPLLATRVAESSEGFTVAGAISMGTESPVSAALLRERDQRVLFLVVPRRRPGEPRPMRDDQWNRVLAERAFDRLSRAEARVYLRHVVSARRHLDWHWGLVSQCRYFRTERIDDGRGYWPNYWMPNPETMGYMTAFLLGQEPPEEGTGSEPAVKCPY